MTRVIGLKASDGPRFWSKVTIAAPAECWEWSASKDRNGYGKFSIGGRAGGMASAHVVAFVLTHGPVPDGREVHHTCRNRACVNPDHLQAVTHRENCSADNSAAAQVNGDRQRAITDCPHGHAYDDANTGRRSDGRRRCLTCDRERAREARAS